MKRQSVTATGQAKRVFVTTTVVWDEDADLDDIDDAIQDAASSAMDRVYDKENPA